MDPKLVAERRKTALQRSDDARRDAGGVPVHAHNGAERLEPERVGEASQQLVAPVVMDDGLADHRAEAGHPVRQPFWHMPTVQRQISGSGSTSHQTPPWYGAIRPHPLPTCITLPGRPVSPATLVPALPACRYGGCRTPTARR